MSRINSLANFLVFAMLCAGIYVYSTTPRDYGPPPSDAWFASEVTNRSEPVLVKFGAEWCGPCRALDPQLDELAGSLAGKVGVVRVNVDQKPELAQYYGVSGIPRLLLFDKGKVIGDRTGCSDAASLQQWVCSHLPN